MGILHAYPPMKMERTECYETSAYEIQTPGNYAEVSIQQDVVGFNFCGNEILVWEMWEYLQFLLRSCRNSCASSEFCI